MTKLISKPSTDNNKSDNDGINNGYKEIRIRDNSFLRTSSTVKYKYF